jgi:hypothetical protein
MMRETLAQITTPKPPRHSRGYCTGIILWDDRVVEAAPCFRFMRRWSRDKVRAYCELMGWEVRVVHELERAR